ncbi:MAG: hypothetical protein KDE50_32800, partial [Caldilineaceae bacterium]|nr:hypothetical protein [Caldilineaceae bacterium]
MNRVDNISVAGNSSATDRQASAATRLFSSLMDGEARWRLLTLIVLFVGAFIMALPFLWLLSSSLKPEQEIFLFPPKWIPNP